MAKQEDFLNRALARLLTGLSIPTDYEQKVGLRRLDMVADVDGLRVVLEAEKGFHRKAQAIKDADARLKQRLATAVFAVCYPDGATEQNLADATLTWTLRLKPDEPSGDWSTGGVPQLAQAVWQAPRSLSGADAAAQMLNEGLDVVVQGMSSQARRHLARALDLPPTKPGGGERAERYFVAAKRGMLVVATAILFHHRVQPYLPGQPPDGFDGAWPPDSASVCAEQASPISAFSEAWRGILAVDYRPVFETGRAALTALSADPDTGQAVSRLARVVAHVSERVAGSAPRPAGPHLPSRAGHRPLRRLVLHVHGRSHAAGVAGVEGRGRRLVGPELRGVSSYLRPRLRHRNAVDGRRRAHPGPAGRRRSSDLEDEEALGIAPGRGRALGIRRQPDSHAHGRQHSGDALANHSRFSRMNIHRTLLGVYDDVPYIGSLEFLSGQARLAAWPSTSQHVESEGAMDERPPPMDLVIMNPPFTRDSLRHDQFNRDDELAIKEREKEVLGDDVTLQWYERLGNPAGPTRAAARLHSSGGAFTVMAEKMLKENTGALALILPSVVPTAPGNMALRKYVANHFHVETIVSSHDPERIFFSENTSIGEILLVCRRWTGEDAKPPTRVINLARNPSTPLEALDAAARIEREGQKAAPSSHDFTVQQVDAERIGRGDWSAVNFLSPFLVDACRTLSEHGPASVSTVPLKELADVGPAGQRIRDAYSRSNMPTPSGRRALWFHKTDVTQSMLAETDVHIEPKASREHLADKYWEQRSDLLLPQRLRLNVARVAAVMLPERAVGSMWMPCRPHDPDVARSLCLYLNSTLGLLSLLGERDNKVPSYPAFSLDTLRSLPVPNFVELESTERDFLNSWFDWLSSQPLLPLPRMDEDPVRRQIDDVVTKALGIDAEWVSRIRRELTQVTHLSTSLPILKPVCYYWRVLDRQLLPTCRNRPHSVTCRNGCWRTSRWT